MFRDANESWLGGRCADLSAYVIAGTVMTASEQMFFLGAPLAHVVRYEDQLSLRRRSIAQPRRARLPYA